MKAVRIFEHGDVNVLKYDNYAPPEVGPRDVLVRVVATSLSFWDVHYRKGGWLNGKNPLPPMLGRKMFPLPMQLGRDAAGVVEAVGEEVMSLAVGDRVAGLPHPENPRCPYAIRGLGNLSTGVDLPGHTMFGGHAQYVSRPEHYWINLPDAVDFAAAAAALWSYATSHRIVKDRLRVALNDVVLITGTSGGMGSATMALAKDMGAQVVGVTRSRTKREALTRMGADHVVVLPPDAAQAAQVRAFTGDLGVDAAVDFTGNPILQRLCIDSLRLGGTFVPGTSDWSQDPLPVSALDLIRLEIAVKGVRASRLDDQRIVVELLAKGLIKPVIHATIPLSEIAQAHAALESGDIVGRMVLDPWA
ncbi:quinone oxidoreductase family protein [Nonomuraea lactucae]|uniref:quinone oxidoreductase family protein n=1 Tax=Nonomuraea lactucae TaxID=2249762 RepID=UPI000DE1A807|nr:zinc-binding dehydrogenase [Nonomuraea lactucae]